MPNKFKLIEYKDGRGLEDLDLNPGEWVGFDNRDIDVSTGFIIVKAKKGITKLVYSSLENQDLILTHVTEPGYTFSLETEGEVFGLYRPFEINGLRFPTISRNIKRYSVEYAFVGEENIIAGLSQVPNFEIYIDWLKGEFARLKNAR